MNFMDKHWIQLFLWTRYNDFHYYREKPASSVMNVHFFRGIQKSFPRKRTTTTTTTNKPFLRPRQRSLAVKNLIILIQTVKECGSPVKNASFNTFEAKLFHGYKLF